MFLGYVLNTIGTAYQVSTRLAVSGHYRCEHCGSEWCSIDPNAGHKRRWCSESCKQKEKRKRSINKAGVSNDINQPN